MTIIALGKNQSRKFAWTKNPDQAGELLAEGDIEYVAPQAANAETAIAAAIVKLGNAGTLLLGDGVYDFSASVTVPSGISIIGVPPVFENSGSNDVFDAGRVYLSGTKLVGDATGTYDCLVGNNTDKGTPDTAFGDNTISNITIKNLYIEGFRHPLKFGAQNEMGVYGGDFDNIWLQDNKEAFEFVNFVHCRFSRIYNRDETQGWAGGMRFAGDCPTATTVLPGNSTFVQFENLKRYRTGKGIRFEATPLAGLNECYAERIEAFSFGSGSGADQGAGYTTDATFNGTADIVVTDGTQFEVGMPVTFTSTIHGFTGGSFAITYFVVSVSTNTINLSQFRGGTAKVATGSSTETAIIKTGGHPAFLVHGDEGAGVDAFNVKNCSFLGMDTEGTNDSAGSGVLTVAQGMLNCKFEMAGVSGGVENHFAARYATNCSLYCDAAIITDFEGAPLISYFGNSRGYINSFSRGTGWWNGQIYGAILKPAIDKGADAQIGTGSAVDVSFGGGSAIRSDTLKGAVRLTTGTGTLAPGRLWTLEANAGKLFFLGTVFPLNANARAVMQNVYTSSYGADTLVFTIGAAGVEYRGTHTPAGTSTTVLTDSNANGGNGWITNELVGMHLQNTTDGSSGVILSNTATTATTASAMTSGQWDQTDTYTITRDLCPGVQYWFGYLSM